MRRGESRYKSNENTTLFHSYYLEDENRPNDEAEQSFDLFSDEIELVFENISNENN